jgi:hypothetical protein
MPVRYIYLKIETIHDYSPVEPDDHVTSPIKYKRDCMRNAGHEDGTIPPAEVEARRLTALVYREYLDPDFFVPKPDKLILADINEPAFDHRVPGTVIYARPGERLRIRVKNGDDAPHSFHVHGLRYGIDSDGAWPFGIRSGDGRRSDEICPGQTWTYTLDVEDYMTGAWPFHDHYRDMGKSINRGLFGGIVVLPGDECDHLPRFPLPTALEELLRVGLTPQQLAGPRARFGHGLAEVPVDLVPILAGIEEDVGAPHLQPAVKPTDTLHVPIFIHVMQGELEKEHEEGGDGGVVNRGAVPGRNLVAAPNLAALPNLVVGRDLVAVRVAEPAAAGGGEPARESLPSLCYNGRSFVGNSPTVVAAAGQKIRWYVFNLDLGRDWHNFHPHGQHWPFANESIDVRSLGPAESFVVETVAPPVLLLPPEIERYQDPGYRPPDAKPFDLRGDFIFHCQSVADMTQGLVGLLRSKQTVWLTPQDATRLRLPLDPGDNNCPEVDFERCANAASGKIEELPGIPGVIFMHAVHLANTKRVLFWGEGPRPDQTRIWDQETGLYTTPANQPADISPNQNLWSGSHAYLNDAAGTILAFGGFGDAATGRLAFLFDPPTLTFSHATDLNLPRFYTTGISLGDGRVMTLFGTDRNAGTRVASFEVFTPGGAGSWSAPETLPFDYLYYPWTFVLPGGELFIAGPQKPARRVDWTATPVVDSPARQFNQVFSQRGVNMDGTAVLLPLRPPAYAPRVLIAGGNGGDTQQSAEWIDLSAATPAWQALPNMNVARDNLNSVLLPDGQLLIVGGTLGGGPDGGPVETFDPEDPAAGFKLGPSIQHIRQYHSAALLLADGSVLIGGDPNGANTPHERYLPPYFFKARPAINSAPTNVAYGANFTVDTTQAADIAEVVLLRPGAVTHAFNMAQRYVGCAIVSAAGASVQATAPPDGSVAPPGYYFLFVVNGERVPSEGVWIKLG